jgi:hypothetical protein
VLPENFSAMPATFQIPTSIDAVVSSDVGFLSFSDGKIDWFQSPPFASKADGFTFKTEATLYSVRIEMFSSPRSTAPQ